MTSRTRVKLIKRLFTDLSSSNVAFTGVGRVLQAARKTDPTIRRSDVEKVLQSIDSYTLHRPKRLRFPTRRYISSRRNKYWQTDLMILSRDHATANKANYILIAQDVFSKKLFLRPLQRKTGGEVVRAFESIFKENKGISPDLIFSDAGTEYISQQTQALFSRRNIKHVVSLNLWHAGIAERTIRSLREMIGRYMTENKTSLYIPKLQDFARAYNQRPHSALPDNLSPDQVTDENTFKVWQHCYGRHLRRAPGFGRTRTLPVGQLVRLTRYPELFKKSNMPNTTDELFKIKKVLQTSPVTYVIEDLGGSEISGKMYYHELVPVNRQ